MSFTNATNPAQEFDPYNFGGGVGEAIGAGMDVYSWLRSPMFHNKDVSRRTVRGRGAQILDRFIQPTQQHLLGKAEDQYRAAPATIRQGFQAARGEASQLTRQAGVQTVERGQQTEANVQQSLANQGMLSSSIAQNARIGIGSQTSRALNTLQAQLARIMTGLQVQGTMAEAGAQQRLGQFYQQRESAEQLPNTLRYQLWTMG